MCKTFPVVIILTLHLNLFLWVQHQTVLWGKMRFDFVLKVVDDHDGVLFATIKIHNT
jgi:membrane protein YdbS with pleckstrin-like domain